MKGWEFFLGMMLLSIVGSSLGGCLEAEVVCLRGTVTEAGSGQPLAGVPVGASRLAEIGPGPAEETVPAETVAFTDEEGRFTLEVPRSLPGLDRVVVFTGGGHLENQIYPGVPFAGRLPRRADLLRPEVKPVDLTREGMAISFALAAFGRRETVMVPMRDGVRLATDIYLPPGKGPFPVLLTRTPYGKGSGQPHVGVALRAGYAVVIQDMRGRFASEGTAIAFLDCGWGERQDGYETVEWIARQPWCNGKIGSVGGSAMGITQNLMAGARPPHLVCQYIAVAAASLLPEAVFQGGAFRKALAQGWLESNQFPPENMELFLAHPTYDDLWRLYDTVARAPVINVPAVHLGGWYDIFCQGTIDAFVARQTRGDVGARGRQKLIMGPWTHGLGRREQGELVYPENAQVSEEELLRGVLRWFDYWLKGKDNGIMDEPPVRYYVMGDVDDPQAPGNEWRTADTWPVPATPTPLYLRAGNRLTWEKPGPEEPPQTYVFDPENPVPTIGGQNLNLPAGPMDQRPAENRPDVLVFSTAPLTEPVEVTGRIKVHLWAASSARDTDFTAKLCDVYPDGRSMLVTDGIIRARYREGLDRQVLLQPGRVYEFEIDLWTTSLVFNRGHRIRVDISSSNYPRFAVNPNTGEPFSLEPTRKVKARNTIYHDAAHPSHILLPVVK
ncbi:MAG TPA: CocE/NonD family hydrolase [Armatimonadetes bacterium]|nr:CocE/NonD family hydrolase [Armatimonadota bacterium]